MSNYESAKVEYAKYGIDISLPYKKKVDELPEERNRGNLTAYEYHEVFDIKHRLIELGAMNAAMSGSGPTVFGIFKDVETAQKAEIELKKRYSQTYLAEPVRKR